MGIYNYFYYHSSVRRRVICAITAVIMASGFVFSYLSCVTSTTWLFDFIIFLILFFLEFRKKIKLDKWDGVLIGGALLMTAIIVGGSLYGSLDSLKAIMDTVYPGKRVSLGGDMPKRDIFVIFFNKLEKCRFKMFHIQIIRKSVVFLSIIFLLFCRSHHLFFYKKIKENIYGFVLFVYCLFNLVWMSVQFPTIFLLS